MSDQNASESRSDLSNEIADGKPCLRVLALDGGGILGAFTAGVLDGLMERASQEEAARAKAESRNPVPVNLLDRVDLIAGTSTGGIIAIALAFGASTSDICGFYETHGPSIFPRDPWKIRSLRSILRYRYDPLPLKKAIQSVIADRPFDEAGCGVIVPATDVGYRQHSFVQDRSPFEVVPFHASRRCRGRGTCNFSRSHIFPRPQDRRGRQLRGRRSVGELSCQYRFDRGCSLPELRHLEHTHAQHQHDQRGL